MHSCVDKICDNNIQNIKRLLQREKDGYSWQEVSLSYEYFVPLCCEAATLRPPTDNDVKEKDYIRGESLTEEGERGKEGGGERLTEKGKGATKGRRWTPHNNKIKYNYKSQKFWNVDITEY